MARIDVPPGGGPESIRAWRAVPELGDPLLALSKAVYSSSRLSARERECLRMRIAEINDCPV